MNVTIRRGISRIVLEKITSCRGFSGENKVEGCFKKIIETIVRHDRNIAKARHQKT